MDMLDLREPVSTLSHAVGLALAIPGTALLWRASQVDRARRLSVLVFGASLVFCYAASARYHAAVGPPERIAALRQLDHVGIHLLIAGTYTPIAVVLLRGTWRRATLTLAWGAALGGSTVILTRGILPTWLSTSFYLGLGWGAYFVYREIGKRHSPSTLRPILHGGIVYSIGAVVNLAGWPDPWPGVLGSHELLHLFVLGGSFLHFSFMLGLVAPVGTVPWSLAHAASRVEAGHRPHGLRRIGRRRSPAGDSGLSTGLGPRVGAVEPTAPR
jgi:hemolysin III